MKELDSKQFTLELYPELDTSAYRQVYELQSETDSKRNVKKGNSVRRLIGTGLLAGALTALSILSPACKSTPPVTPPPIVQPTPAQPTSTQTPTMQQQYRSQITQYLMQDVPALSQDAKAFNYTVDRLTEWGTTGIKPVDYQSIRASLIKWIDANITWQNKGERLYLMSETDFLTDTLFDNTIPGRSVKGDDYTKLFQKNVDYLVENHGELWQEMQKPDQMKKHFDEASSWIDSNVERSPEALAIAKTYKKAVWEKGTNADRISYATYGYIFPQLSSHRFDNSSEGSRIPLAALYLASIGGEAPYGRMVFTTGVHGEPAIKISPQLEAEYRNNPQIYGTKLDNGYLTVPYNREGAEAMAAYHANTPIKMIRVEREVNFWTGKTTVLWQK